MAGNLRGLDAGAAHLLSPRDIGTPAGVDEAGEIAALGRGCTFQSLPDAGIPQPEATAINSDEGYFSCAGTPGALAVNGVSNGTGRIGCRIHLSRTSGRQNVGFLVGNVGSMSGF